MEITIHKPTDRFGRVSKVSIDGKKTKYWIDGDSTEEIVDIYYSEILIYSGAREEIEKCITSHKNNDNFTHVYIGKSIGFGTSHIEINGKKSEFILKLEGLDFVAYKDGDEFSRARGWGDVHRSIVNYVNS